MNNILLALAVSQADPWAKQMWWDWLGSWVFIGGPFGRWAVGTILGYRLLKTNSRDSNQQFPGCILEMPHLRILIVAGLGSMLSLFAMGLAVVITWNVFRGQTSLDTYRPSKLRGSPGRPSDILICVPSQDGMPQSAIRTATLLISTVYHVIPGERLYDLGWSRNFEQMASQPLFRDSVIGQSGIYIWPQLNPSILNRIRRQTRSGFGDIQ